MKKKWLVLCVICCISVIAVMMVACSDESYYYADGTYTARSEDFGDDDTGSGSGYGVVTLTIENGEITECEFLMYELDGTLKDSTYGSDLSKESYTKAQKAVQSAKYYAQQLVSKGNIDDVEIISGATISYREFVDAVTKALEQAKVIEE